MTIFRDEAHLYRVLDAFFTRVRDTPSLAEAMVSGRFVLRFRYKDPAAEVTVDLRGQPITWHLGPCELQPDLEMIQSADTAHKFWMGSLSVPRALATRQVVSRGNVAKALKLLPALKPAFVLYADVLRELGEDALLAAAGGAKARAKANVETGAKQSVRASGDGGDWGAVRRRPQGERTAWGRFLAKVGRLAGRAFSRSGSWRSPVRPPATPWAATGPVIPLFDGPAPAPPAFRQPDLPEPGPALDRAMLARMWLIRAFEERISEANARGEIPTEAIHLSIGQEATAVGVCFALRGDDYLATTHRGHGHMLAKGANLGGMMDELLAKATGLCGGKGGSMHVTEAAVGAIGANGIVGASPLMAAGAAHAARRRGSDQVAVAFLGDGATNQGMFHEGMNFAAVLDLPALFVVENNLYGEFTPLARHCRVPRLADRAAAYGMPGHTVDGNDVRAVYEATRAAVARARAGEGPTLLECLTYRWHGHMEGEDLPYRSAEEIASWRERCPIAAFRRRLLSEGTLTEPEAEAIEREAKAAVARAWEAALAAPQPTPEALLRDVFAPEPRSLYEAPPGSVAQKEEPGEPRQLTGSEAIREALAEELERDPRVYLLGEDVTTGGYFAVTAGLVDRFGTGRIVDTPISEYAIVGSAVGAALAGARPVAEILFSDFITTCMDPLVNQAAKLRYMSGGQVELPLVVRTPGGGGLGMAAQHSQSLEALLTGIPGLIVLAPGTPADAKGLLKAAIRSHNPVLFFENKLLYPTTGPAPALAPGAEHLVPIGKAEVKRPGRDVTLVSVGAILGRVLEAAETLAAEGVEVEVVDLRSLVPLDLPTVLASVHRTGRLVTVEDGCLGHGFGSEILARVTEAAFGSLRAAPRRVAGADVPLPYNVALENLALPDAPRIAAAVREVLGA